MVEKINKKHEVYRDLTFYKKDARGAIRTWRVEVDGNRLRTIAGIHGGAQTVSEWRTYETRHPGDRYEISGRALALRKAKSMQKRNLEQLNYHLDPKLVDKKRFFEPMLAKEFNTRKLMAFRHPLFAQPKIDGIRAVARPDGLFSRRGKKFACTGHIEEALRDVFEEWPDLIIDGELYDPAFPDDFGEIQSLIMKSNISADHAIELERRLKFFVFDCAGDAGDRAFDLRHGIIHPIAEELQILGYPIVAVPTFEVRTLDDIDMISLQFLEQGWEGTMIRIAKPDSGYDQTRSPLLLKKKEFFSREFKVVRLLEGQGNYQGMAKAVLLKTPDERGRFKAGIKGNQPFLRELWTERNTYKEGEATVKFQMFSKKGIPRFPVAVALHPGGRSL